MNKRETEDSPTRPHSQTPAPIILAAGASRRMGARNKLLLPFRGRALVAQAVAAARAATGGAAVVVTGHERERVEAALSGHAVRFVHNAAYRSGMASSLRCGVAAAAPDAGGYLVCLGDMPHVSAEALRLLCRRFLDAPGGAIVTFAGAPGPPIVFDRSHREALLQLDGDTGAQPLLRRYAGAVVRVSPTEAGLPGEALFDDIDTPEAYRRLTESQRASD